MSDPKDDEANRISARAARYVRVGTNVGAVAARVASQRLFGMDSSDAKNAAALASALGGLKGPIMKVAQLLATIPEALPAEYAQELSQLQSQAPPMGPAFVRRRMMATSVKPRLCSSQKRPTSASPRGPKLPKKAFAPPPNPPPPYVMNTLGMNGRSTACLRRATAA